MTDSCAICCPGPSLRNAKGLGEYPCIIAVNYAAVYLCEIGQFVDWFCGIDEATMSKVGADAKPVFGIMSNRGGVDAYNNGDTELPQHLQSIVCEDVPEWKQYGHLLTYSGLAALVMAEHLGYHHADVFGMDLGGDTYACSVPHRPLNVPDRWERERGMLDELTALQAANGFTHRRVA